MPEKRELMLEVVDVAKFTAQKTPNSMLKVTKFIAKKGSKCKMTVFEVFEHILIPKR